ncbi:hypothetical protein Zmor_018307 [Zophobas morio]|uniref:Gustatory receptor n=1 Tax=Zophobas morio TaxID=2755281 RepID=A0AA38IAX2_9CUCU|nr:hypothetical protein Zmor_018307 [Zophobas morio]
MEKSLTLFFKIGSILTITPAYSKNTTRFQKFYTYVLVVFITVAATVSVKNRDYPSYCIYAKIAVNLLTDANLIICTSTLALAVVVWRKDDWQKLMENLKTMISLGNKNKLERNIKIHLITLFVDFVMIVLIYIYWSAAYHGFMKYVTSYLVQYCQSYILYCYTTFVGFILNVIKSHYVYLNTILQQEVMKPNNCSKRMFLTLTKTERTMYYLKDTADNFNNATGWSTALLISYTSLYILNNFDYIYQVSVNHEIGMGFHIIAEGFSVFLLFVRTSTVIIKCDLILHEAEKILDNSYILRRNCYGLSDSEKNRLKEFSESVLQNLPKFSAARFFNINRSTILSMLATDITFLIIMIQFHGSAQ